MKHFESEVYEEVFAHRGFHLNYPENTLKSFARALEQNFAIELDVRLLKCGTIVCFHDMYMKRLLGVPGRISKRTFSEIKNYKVLGTKCKVPKFKDVLNMVKGRVTVLIEIKGLMSKAYQSELERILSNYQGKIFFHTTNVITYFRAKKVWKEKVFFVFNPFRKRFEFVKGKHYKSAISIPKIDDFIVEAEDSSKTVIKKIWTTFNRLNTRVKSDHWLLSYNGKKNQIQHRGIVDKDLKEHSKEAFEKCVELKKVIELDVVEHEGKIVCYHDDRITTRMGQKKSISDKPDIKSSLLFENALAIIGGKVPIIVDIKDFSIFDRSLEDSIMKQLNGYKGEFVIQSFNPLVNMHMMRNYENVLRGQVGHSLNGIKKMRKVILTVVNFCLFYRGRPDYIVYDLDPDVHLLSKFNNILGLPVIGYAVVKKEDITAYSSFFDNFIVEGDFKS